MRFLFVTTALAVTFGMSGTAAAQNALEGRVDRLEREVRAVQRKVFPGGAGQTIEPQITPDAQTSVPGIPAGSVLTDLTGRINALEDQVRTLTGQVEQDGHRLRLLEDAFNAYKRGTDTRIQTLENGRPAGGGGDAGFGDDAPADAPVRTPPRNGGAGPATGAGDPPRTAPGNTNAAGGARATRLAAVERPASKDPAEDGYIYGFRLWQAKFYPEARKELEAVAAKYPKHRRASYAQNLLGRVYLDSGAPSLAAIAFYDNFKKNPEGERAPDSLFYLAQTLPKLGKPRKDVCNVYAELMQLYGDKITPEMKADVRKGQAEQKCQ